jgi:hypothetical protein
MPIDSKNEAKQDPDSYSVWIKHVWSCSREMGMPGLLLILFIL